MAKIQNETAYKAAMERIEELLPLVDDNIPANDKNAVELSVMSDIDNHFLLDSLIVAIEREDELISMNQSTVFRLGDLVWIVGDREKIRQLLMRKKHV